MKLYIVCTASPNNDSPIFGVYQKQEDAVSRRDELRKSAMSYKFCASVFCVESDVDLDGIVFAFDGCSVE